MNHNGTVDRFENTKRPTSLSPRPSGLNVYVFLWPDVRLTVGRQHLREQLTTGGEATTRS